MTVVVRDVPKELFEAFREQARARGESPREALIALMRLVVDAKRLSDAHERSQA